MSSDTYEEDLLEDRIKTNVFDLVLFKRMAGYATPYWRRMIVGALLMAPVSSSFLGFVFGPDFRASGPLFNVLLWEIVPFSLANIIIGYLLGTKRLKPVVVSASIGLAVLVGLDFALVPQMGAAGAAVGRAVALNVMAVVPGG